MTRPRAGYVGFTRTPTSTAASGVWTLREAEASKRAAAWPDTRPAEGSDPFFASVSILLHMDGANAGTTFTDNSGTPKTVTAAGNAVTSTARSKFGTASALFDGSGDYLATPSNAAYAFGTGDFTVECWVYRTSAPALASIMGVGYTIGGFGLGIDSSNNVCVTRPGTAIDHTFAGAVPMNAWSHIAITRSGTSLRCFVDGVQKGSTASNSTNYAQGELVIGMDSDKANQGFVGNIDEFRITKGTARYTSSFSVPTEAFPDTITPGTFVAIPLMTSATSPSGTASASAILGAGLDAFRAFDKATVPNDGTFYASPSPATNSWIQYDFGAGLASGIGGYTITSRNLSNYGDSSSGLSQVPSAWTLSGSSDGTTFAVIDTRTGESFTQGQTRTFTLSAPAAYRVFRWTWTANPAGGAVIVPKIQLVAVAAGGGTPAFAVSGAGTAAANGTYCESGTLNGRPRYIYGSYCIEYASDWIVNDESNGPAWLIRLSSTDLYYASVTTATPPLSGWGAFSGSSPAPTLSSTTC